MEVSGYELTTESRDEYLFARVHAVRMTPDVAKQAMRETRSALMDARTGRLLIKYELAHPLSEDEMLAVMNNIMEIMPGMRIAFLASNPSQMAALTLGTSMSAHAGEDHNCFSDRVSAEQWLLES